MVGENPISPWKLLCANENNPRPTPQVLTAEEVRAVEEVKQKFQKLFSGVLGETNISLCQMHITDTGNSNPVKEIRSRQSPEKRAEMQRRVISMLEGRIIRKSQVHTVAQPL